MAPSVEYVREPTLLAILAGQARRTPDRPFLRVPERELSYGEADCLIDAYAAGLRDLAITPGDRVALLMTNHFEHVLVWLALNRIGAVNVPINTALTGDLLTRSLRPVRPAALVVDGDVVPALEEVLGAAGCVDRPVFVNKANGAPEASRPGMRRLTDLRGSRPCTPAHPHRLAAATMLFTSGSTGVPKACVLSHHYMVRQAQIHAQYLGFRPDDVLYTPFPLFHIDGATLTVGAALVTGATAALSKRFAASRFWDEVRSCEATVFNFMEATGNILWKQPPSDRDREHRVRLVWGVPMPACEPEWQERFGHPLVEVYGLTDAGVPAYQLLDEPRRPGSCGRVIPEYEVQIADEHGEAVPVGTVGEICIRSQEPGLMMNEYFDMPDKTDEAFRGGWFHTGDLGRLDADNHLHFVTRSKEVIRRRGENIAATDVEETINSHPTVRESAAVGVPSELSEDDIRAVVVAQPSATLSVEEVREHCERTLPPLHDPALPRTRVRTAQDLDREDRALQAGIAIPHAPTRDAERNSTPDTARRR